MFRFSGFSGVRRGFTLLELVVVIVILGVLITIGVYWSGSSVKAANDRSALAAVQQMAHDAAGSSRGLWDRSDFEATLVSFGDARFDSPGSLALASSRFGQFAFALSADGRWAGLAVRS